MEKSEGLKENSAGESPDLQDEAAPTAVTPQGVTKHKQRKVPLAFKAAEVGISSLYFLASYPQDVLKVLSQVTSISVTRRTLLSGPLAVTSVIYQQGGLAGFWTGLLPGISASALSTLFGWGTKEVLRSLCNPCLAEGGALEGGAHCTHSCEFYHHMHEGAIKMCASCVAIVASYPFVVTRTRCIAGLVGFETLANESTLWGPLSLFEHVGWNGLFTGLPTALAVAVIEQLVRALIMDILTATARSTMKSGQLKPVNLDAVDALGRRVGWWATYPLEMIFRRQLLGGAAGGSLFRAPREDSIPAWLWTMYSDDGVFALWKGATAAFSWEMNPMNKAKAKLRRRNKKRIRKNSFYTKM